MRPAQRSCGFFRPSAKPAFVDTEGAGAESHDEQHPAHEAEVLHEMIELVLILRRVHRPEIIVRPPS
jgi:hypothetical protein